MGCRELPHLPLRLAFGVFTALPTPGDIDLFGDVIEDSKVRGEEGQSKGAWSTELISRFMMKNDVFSR